MKIECEFCHTVFEAEAPKEFGDTSRGVIQALVCTYCGLVKPLARISHDGLKMRDLMNLLRSKGKPVPEELVQTYQTEFTTSAAPVDLIPLAPAIRLVPSLNESCIWPATRFAEAMCSSVIGP